MNKVKLNELEALNEKLLETQNEYHLLLYRIISEFRMFYDLYFKNKNDNKDNLVKIFYFELTGFMEAVKSLHKFIETKNDVDMNNILLLLRELYRDIEDDHLGRNRR